MICHWFFFLPFPAIVHFCFETCVSNISVDMRVCSRTYFPTKPLIFPNFLFRERGTGGFEGVWLCGFFCENMSNLLQISRRKLCVYTLYRGFALGGFRLMDFLMWILGLGGWERGSVQRRDFFVFDWVR